MCLYPKLMPNPKYRANKKNGGIVPVAEDARVLYVPVGCTKCIECKRKKAREWQVRLNEELKHDKTGKFVTLTFSNESIAELNKELEEEIKGYKRDNAIATLAVRRYLGRWRKKYGKSVKHWLVTELGGNGTENIHLHGIIFTDNVKEIKEIWKYGFVYVGDYVNEETVGYIIKYMTKMDEKHKGYQQAMFPSPGIGAGYLKRTDWKKNKYKKGETIETYKSGNGANIPMPIYYRNKIYSEKEKEELWIEKLDKQKRYVLGIEIDVSENEDRYYKVLETARKKNKRLGYATDEENWIREEYENQRRSIMLETRIKNANKNKDVGRANEK